MATLLIACISAQHLHTTRALAAVTSQHNTTSHTTNAQIHDIDLVASPSHSRTHSLSRITVTSPLVSSTAEMAYASTSRHASDDNMTHASSFPSREFIHPSSLIESVPGTPTFQAVSSPTASPYISSHRILPPLSILPPSIMPQHHVIHPILTIPICHHSSTVGLICLATRQDRDATHT